ncbi:MAG: PP2C family protein-serine/threonine phosphatase [Syntrophomonadaceae bacterium]|nr:PP2C family protein-serine/threonine phosphatase [Syntrophomonadaceae bacterium]
MRKKFLLWLLFFMMVAFIAAFYVSYTIQSRQAYNNAEKLIFLKINDVIKQISINNKNLDDIRWESDTNALAKARAFAWMLEKDPGLVNNYEELEKIRKLLDVDEMHITDGEGILISGTVKEYYNYRFAADKQSAAFLPAIKDKTFELAQDPQPKGINGEIFQYVGVARKDADGIVQIGYRPEKLANAMEVADIKNLAPGFRVGNSGSVIIATKTGVIVSAADKNFIAKTIYEFCHGYDPKGNSGSFIRDTYDGKSLIAYKEAGDYIILGKLPADEMYLSRNSTTTVMILFNILLFSLIFFLVARLVQTVVIDGIFAVNKSLAEITQGNLNEKVEVNTSEEFQALSYGINSMVEALKDSIKEAAARIDDELAFARAIQLSALPNHFPAFPEKSEIEIFADMYPAKEVGGDFYDFFFIGEDKLVVVIADVSGKGIPAAMFMMISKTLIKNFALSGISPAEVFFNANQSLCENNDAGMFVTAFMGLLDCKTGILRYVNAGHNPPLIKNADGTAAWLPTKPGLVLAGMEGVTYVEQEIKLQPGDMLFLYTDGVTEACNHALELYTDHRLLEELNHYTPEMQSTAAGIVQYILQTVQSFADGAEQADDITILCVKYQGYF